jgi:predicted house-cleaning noncanonical NTP pyrophosphatase (MazG superfamily)
MTMADERNPQVAPQDEVKATEEVPEELSDKQLDEVAGGMETVTKVTIAASEVLMNSTRNMQP